jgi:Flp pilus assembly secretin CpaC
MMALVCRRGIAPGLFLVLASAVFTLGLSGGLSVAIAADVVSAVSPGNMVVVHIDQAKILKLPDRTATLVIGNPLIADAVAQAGGVAVITGKSYGATNLVALDRTGAILFDSSIQVLGPADKVVIVYRSVERETYSCMPNCERRTTVGDSAGYFTANLNQIGSLGALAQTGGAAQQSR